MKYLLVYCLAITFWSAKALEPLGSVCLNSNWGNVELVISGNDSLPLVFTKNHADLISSKLKLDAALKFTVNQLPNNFNDWETQKGQLKRDLLLRTGVSINHDLPLNVKVTGMIQMKGYSIQMITFQTRPGIFATANLFVPEGKGLFPAVVLMIGHWPKGKIDTEGSQQVGHSLALNGYVCLSIDPWGSGERTTIHGNFEDHGDANNLGSSVLNIGETLMGIEISDNMRGVDLLCSLPYVDPKNIGATGASGGGNQTMWLTAMDERVKAAMPVVSVGTFESYIMGTPCICEVVADALNLTEEAGILALVAPRAIKMCNHLQDDNKAFYPPEMIRTYTNAKPVFKMYGAENNIKYQLFDLQHGYLAEDREAMLGWFDLHLKKIGSGSSKKEIPFEVLPEEKLMVFPVGKRDANVVGTAEYCKQRGTELRTAFLNTTSFDTELKKNELRKILGISEKSRLSKVCEYSKINGWSRFGLETSDNKLIPILLKLPSDKSKAITIVTNPEGKEHISLDLIDELTKSGKGIAIIDLSGTGEAASKDDDYHTGRLRAISRSELWFGRTVIGEWVKELQAVVGFLKSTCPAQKIEFDGSLETGLAGLFLAATEEKMDYLTLRDTPVSYLFDCRETVDFYSMAIQLPGILNWGDISLAAALSGTSIHFVNPLTISGQKITDGKLQDFQVEFDQVRIKYKQAGATVFN